MHPTSFNCRISNVTKRFGRTTALDDVSFSIDATGVTGLLGPNGAGKTTLLRILATVLAPDSGSVSVLGRDPSTSSGRRAIRRQLGYMPQETGFHRRLTAFAFLDYVAVLKEITARNDRDREVGRVLGLVDLEDRANTRIHALSGGMRRRLALAQALLGDPRILVLDEPTAGLDPEQRMRLRDLLSHVGEERTVVISTHQTDDVAALCHRVLVLGGSRIRFDGAPAELAGLAAGRVWLADDRDPAATLAWRDPNGRYRHVGAPPPGAEVISPSLEDGYLLALGPGSSAAQADVA